MAKTVITLGLDSSSIDDAIKQIEAYQKDLEEKSDTLRVRIADTVRDVAQETFKDSQTSDILPKGGKPDPCTVVVTTSERAVIDKKGEDTGKMMSVVTADGDQAVFVEFGAGIYHNGSAGASPHPYVNGLGGPDVAGFLIGSYGKGQGARTAWTLPKELWTETDENGNPIKKVTRGTKARMPMYHGAQYAILTLSELAREVFGE